MALSGMIPEKWSPDHTPPYAEEEVVDQEAAHQARWNALADWCWERDKVLACRVDAQPRRLYELAPDGSWRGLFKHFLIGAW